MKVEVGDWVTAYSKGIFRVEKIIKRYYDDSHVGGVLGNHKIGDEFTNPIVVLKKCFNSSLKPSVDWDSCDMSFCNKLDQELSVKVQEILKNNPKIIDRINSFQIPPLSVLHNISLFLKDENDIKIVENIIPFIKTGMTFLEVKKKMQELDIEKFKISCTNKTLQLICIDYEINNQKKLIFRDARVF